MAMHELWDGRLMATNPSTPELLRCGSYLLGHEVHYIQANLSRREAATPGHVTVGQDGWITIETDDGQLRRWTHHPAQLQHLIDEHGPDVQVRAHGLLAFPGVTQPNGTTAHDVVSIADAASPCPTGNAASGPVSAEELFDQLLTRGGFVARVTRQPAPSLGDNHRPKPSNGQPFGPGWPVAEGTDPLQPRCPTRSLTKEPRTEHGETYGSPKGVSRRTNDAAQADPERWGRLLGSSR